jgi:preprotein translocase subunit SecG
MDSTTLIRIIAGVLVVVILIVLIQRRRTRIK